MRRRACLGLLATLAATGAVRHYDTLEDGTKFPRKTTNDALARHYHASPTAGIAVQRGPWYDYWLALGGTDAIYNALDVTARAWLQVEQIAKLKTAQSATGPFPVTKTTFAKRRLARFGRALAAGNGSACVESQHLKCGPLPPAPVRREDLAARLERELSLGATGTTTSRGDRTFFVVVSIQRTGSTWLTMELNSHPCIASAGELFMDAKAYRAAGTTRQTTWSWTEAARFEYLESLVNGNMRLENPLSVSVPKQQTKWRDRCVDRQDQGGSAGIEAEACGFKWMLSQGVDLAWDAWFGNVAERHGIRLVFLKRENLLRNFLSWYDKERHAMLNGGDGRVVDTKRFKLPCEVLVSSMEKTAVQFAHLDTVEADAKKRGMRTLSVTYEQLMRPRAWRGAKAAAQDKAAGLARVAEFVLPTPGACAGGFTFAGQEDAGDVVLHKATIAETITNWPEVVATLQGTRFEKYLTMDGSVLP